MVVNNYGLGKLSEFSIVPKGLIELNVRIQTTTGMYVVKLFSNKRLPRVKDLLYAQKHFDQIGLPVAKILHGLGGKQYFKLHSHSGIPYYGCVMSWFDGHDFSECEPDKDDLKTIASMLAKIHATSANIKPIYDEWFPSNYLLEYKRNRKILDVHYLPLMNKIATEIKSIRFDEFRLGLIHGDLSREHILKDNSGMYCIIDFGGVNINYPVVDLAFMMSFYCLDLTSDSFPRFMQSRFSIILDKYRSMSHLSNYEIQCLPILIQANYALSYIAGNYYQRKNKDESAKNGARRTVKTE